MPPGTHPHDVAPAPDGTVWYTAQLTGKLGRLDPETGKTTEIPLGEGRSFVMVAENSSAENVYVQSAELNGVPLDRPQLLHEDVMRGGTLLLRMGPAPSTLWNDWRGE